MTKSDALEYIYTQRNGAISALKEKIGVKNYRDFQTVGFIAKGVDNTTATWKITRSAKNMYEGVYKKPNFYESILGYFCHYVLKF